MCYMKPDYGPFNDPLKGIPRNPNQQPIRDFSKNKPWRLNPNEKKWRPTHPSPLTLPDDFWKFELLDYIKCPIEEATCLKNLKTNELYNLGEQKENSNTFKFVKKEVWVSKGKTLIYVIDMSQINNSVYQPLKTDLSDINIQGSLLYTDFRPDRNVTILNIEVSGNYSDLSSQSPKVKITTVK
jgi:hypothetical protein